MTETETRAELERIAAESRVNTVPSSPTPISLVLADTMARLEAALQAPHPDGAEDEQWRKWQQGRDDQEKADRARRERDKLAAAYAAIGVPLKFAELAASTLTETAALKVIRQVGRNMPLVLAGPPGVGKTAAAAWWVLDGWQQGSPLFVTSSRLARWDRYDDAAMTKILGASRLVIDDIGEEYADTKGNFLSVFGEVISGRAAAELPTVITTNLTWEDARQADGQLRAGFRSRYGERIADRIRESGRLVSCAGESLRKRPDQVPAVSR